MRQTLIIRQMNNHRSIKARTDLKFSRNQTKVDLKWGIHWIKVQINLVQMLWQTIRISISMNKLTFSIISFIISIQMDININSLILNKFRWMLAPFILLRCISLNNNNNILLMQGVSSSIQFSQTSNSIMCNRRPMHSNKYIHNCKTKIRILFKITHIFNKDNKIKKTI